MTKSASVTTIIRDENGNSVSETTCEGLTNDDGATVVMGIGNLPAIGDCLAGDIIVRVSTVNVTQPTLVSIDEDTETGLQTFTFTNT